ncbi:MAG TPA: hypothetical protein VKB19_09255 [Pedobacter sp.]|nr:hypothetical protein [Pedobacter sp.]
MKRALLAILISTSIGFHASAQSYDTFKLITSKPECGKVILIVYTGVNCKKLDPTLHLIGLVSRIKCSSFILAEFQNKIA